MSEKSSFTPIEKMGREHLIENFQKYATVHRSEVVSGIGDDAAVIKADKDRLSLLSHEVFVEGVDFDLTYTPLKHLGYKVVTAGVSDIYAMNGKPEALLIGLAVPNRISVEMIEECYKGIQSACSDYNSEISGGDVTATQGAFVITVSVFGTVSESKVVYRSGAKINDAVCVTGDLGSAMAGLRILLREKKVWHDSGEEEFHPDLGDYEYVVKRQLVPVARNDLIEILGKENITPGAMIDLSQGLINSLKYLTDSSGTGAYLYEAALPVAPETRIVADEMKEDVDRYTLYGGEDYELLFTAGEKEVNRLAGVFKDFSVIGKISKRDEGIRLQQANGDVWSFGDDPDQIERQSAVDKK